jgi:hypothetical protein
MQLGRGHRPQVDEALHVNAPTFAEQLAAALRAPEERRYAALLCWFAPSPQRDRLVAELRVRLAERVRIPVTVGHGPRYLHSTGQLHKGGANTVLPIVLTAAGGEDLPIPGTDYTFGMLERAQAEADAEALREAGRPVVRVALDGVERGLKTVLDALAPPKPANAKRARAS